MAIHMKMILLSLVMLLIAFEPAFSGKILKKLDKELKKMGLQKLQKFLADIGENAVEIGNNANEIDSNIARIDNNIGDVQNNIGVIQNEIDSNTAHINTNTMDIGTNTIDIGTNTMDIGNNANEIDSNIARIDTNTVDIGDNRNDIVSLKTNGSGSVWFDAWRTTELDTSNAWKTITYTNVRESNSGAMDIGTGVFTAQLAGTYQFMIQVAKEVGVDGEVQILLDGNTPAISYITDRDQTYSATITGTAIVKMQPGQMVRAETRFDLYSYSGNPRIHFTGVLITPD